MEHLLQMIAFEEMVEFYTFYRDPKKFFTPFRISLLEWQKIETICDSRYKREKKLIQQDDISFEKKTARGT